jgi:protein-S-isoprenylcysteine O-methyltransferase Ste14
VTTTRRHAFEDRLPELGPRGEGWVAIQATLLIVLLLSGLAGPALSGTARLWTVGLGLVLLAVGAGLAGAGIVRQRRQLTALPRPTDRARLVEDGPYRLVRHPMYGGLVLASFGWALATASAPALGVACMIGVFFDLKSRREERWLTERFPGYDTYRARTKRLVPWMY